MNGYKATEAARVSPYRPVSPATQALAHFSMYLGGQVSDQLRSGIYSKEGPGPPASLPPKLLALVLI